MILHQAVDSVTAQIYTWTAETYDHGAGYPGPNSPTNILVSAGITPSGGSTPVSPLVDISPDLELVSGSAWITLARFSVGSARPAILTVQAYVFGATGTLQVQIVNSAGTVTGSLLLVRPDTVLQTKTSTSLSLTTGDYSLICLYVGSGYAAVETVSVA